MRKDSFFIIEVQKAIRDFEKKRISRKRFFILVARAGKKLSTGYSQSDLTPEKKSL